MSRSKEEIEAMLNEASGGDAQPEAVSPLQDTVEPIVEVPEVVGTTEIPEESPDSFTDYDLSALEPEVAAAAEIARRRMQADYTRKTTAIADRERQLEQRFGDLQLAEDAISFYERIHNDPSYAMQFVPRMLTALKQSGFDQELANVAQQFVPQTSYTPNPNVAPIRDEDYEYVDFDDDYNSNPLAPKLDNLERRLENYERQTQQQALATRQEEVTRALVGEWQRQEAALMDYNKHYKDDDLDYIYELASATGGSLFEAQKLYENIQLHGLNRYVASKKLVGEPSGGSYTPGSGSTPGLPAPSDEERGSMSNARQRALARVRAADL